MDEYLGSLLSADPDFLPLTWPATLQATQSFPYIPTQILNTPYLEIIDPLTPPRNLHQSFPANLTTPDKTIFPRPQTLLISDNAGGPPLAQMIPQTQLKSHQPHFSTFKLPSPTKTTTVETSTVNIQLDPTSVPINRPKFFITISSINGNSSKPSKTNNIPQTNTMYSSPHEWTKRSNHAPPPSMATQPSISTTSNLPV